MTRYLISFPSDAMDHIPEEEMPEVARAARGHRRSQTRRCVPLHRRAGGGRGARHGGR